jgi:uncharacterized protein (TIGR03084 family)
MPEDGQGARGGVFEDLRAEGDALDAVVTSAGPAGWTAATPSQGWTVAHQIAHLTWVDGYARLAATDADRFFPTLMGELEGAGGDVVALLDTRAAEGLAEPVEAVLARWRQGRQDLIDVLRETPADARLPWFGGPDLPQTPAELAAARLMEWWAHGQDVADAVGVTRPVTDRVRHVADVSVANRSYAFTTHDRPAPTRPVRVELTGPSGQSWAWGPADATDTVTGSALDFCLLMTQRIHRDDTGLRATGEEADQWLDVAQAYAGPPGGKRPRRDAAP